MSVHPSQQQSHDDQRGGGLELTTVPVALPPALA
jgi:hypothetical protein